MLVSTFIPVPSLQVLILYIAVRTIKGKEYNIMAVKFNDLV